MNYDLCRLLPLIQLQQKPNFPRLFFSFFTFLTWQALLGCLWYISSHAAQKFWSRHSLASHTMVNQFLLSERPEPTCRGQRGLGFRRGRTEERARAMPGWPGWSCGWNPLGRGDHPSKAEVDAHLSWCRGAQSPHTRTRVWTPAGGRGTANRRFIFKPNRFFLFSCIPI